MHVTLCFPIDPVIVNRVKPIPLDYLKLRFDVKRCQKMISLTYDVIKYIATEVYFPH